MNMELAKEREKLEQVALELTEEYERIKKFVLIVSIGRSSLLLQLSVLSTARSLFFESLVLLDAYYLMYVFVHHVIVPWP